MNWKQFQRDKPRLFKTNYSRAPIYAKLVTHRITPYVVFLSLKWGLTPDQVTFLSMLAGWTAAVLFAFPSRAMVLAAALALEAYYVLDSVDGQLARITGKCSKTGAFYDILLNSLVHPLVFICIGVGQYRITGQAVCLLYGALAAISYVWLGLMWNVRAHVLWEAGLTERGLNAKERGESRATKNLSLPRKIFAALHKLCTYPTLMNLVTLTAVWVWATGKWESFRYLLIFYSGVIPFVSLAKIAKVVLALELDQEVTGLRSGRS